MKQEKIQIYAAEYEPINRPSLDNYDNRMEFFLSKIESFNSFNSEEYLKVVMELSSFLAQVEFNTEKQYPHIDKIIEYLFKVLDTSANSLIYFHIIEIFCTLIKESKYYFKILVNNGIVDKIMEKLFTETMNDLFDSVRFKILILIFKKKKMKSILSNYIKYEKLTECYCLGHFGPITKLNILCLLRIYFDILKNDEHYLFIKSICSCFQCTDNIDCFNELILITCIIAQANNDNPNLLFETGLLKFLSEIDLKLINNDSIVNLLLIYQECTKISSFINSFDFSFAFKLALNQNIKISSNSMALIASIIINGNDEIQLKCINDYTMKIIIKGFVNGTNEMKYSAIIIYGNLCLNLPAEVISNNFDLSINQYLIEILQTTDNLKFQLLILGVFGSLISKLSPIGNFYINQLLEESGTIEFLQNIQVCDNEKQNIIDSFIKLVSFTNHQ